MTSLFQPTPPADVANAESTRARLLCSQGTHAVLRDRGGDLLSIRPRSHTRSAKTSWSFRWVSLAMKSATALASPATKASQRCCICSANIRPQALSCSTHIFSSQARMNQAQSFFPCAENSAPRAAKRLRTSQRRSLWDFQPPPLSPAPSIAGVNVFTAASVCCIALASRSFFRAAA